MVGVEIQCIGHFRLLFSLLRVDGRSKMQQYALEVSVVYQSVVCLCGIEQQSAMHSIKHPTMAVVEVFTEIIVKSELYKRWLQATR